MSLLVYHKCFRNWSSLQILMPQHPGPGYDFFYKFMTRCLQMFYKTVSIYPDFLWNLTAAGLKVIYFACLGIVITNIALLWLPDKVISKAMASGMMWPAHLHKAKPRRTPHCCVLLANQILSIKSENTHSTEKMFHCHVILHLFVGFQCMLDALLLFCIVLVLFAIYSQCLYYLYFIFFTPAQLAWSTHNFIVHVEWQ